MSIDLNLGWKRKLSMVYQTETSDCALACLAMVTTYHGFETDVPNLRRRFIPSLKGTSLWRLVEIAGSLGFQARPLKVALEELKSLKTPCVLHWKMNHFVVLDSATKSHIIIYDPAVGIRRLTYKEASTDYTGVALEIEPGPDFVESKETRSISFAALTGRVVGLRTALLTILCLSLVVELLSLVSPIFTQTVLDQVIVNYDIHFLYLLAIGFSIVLISLTVFSAIRSWAITYLSANLSLSWTGNVFAHLFKLPAEYFFKRHLGDVVSRFGAIGVIQTTLTTRFVGVVLDGLMSCLTLVMMFMYSNLLAVVAVSTFAIYTGVRVGSYRVFREANLARIVAQARQQSLFLESVRGAQTVKLYNMEASQTARYINKATASLNKDVVVQRYGILFGSINTLIFGIQSIVIITLGANLVINGTMSEGMLVAFFAYSAQFVTRAGALVDYGVDLRMLRLHGERLSDIVLEKPEKYVQTGYSGPTPLAKIELRGVSYRYSSDTPWILRNCDLVIDVGESVAIVGPSGCGKSTLAKLLVGLLEPEEGTILFGDIDIKHLGKTMIRRMTGAVLQDDQLFAGTIFDNIALHDHEADVSRVDAVTRMAAIDQDIAKMPMGYHTLVGDMGSSLSGGQKQRLLLARALYKDPQILLLDEATSHLDVDRERMVNMAVRCSQLTRIVIAHRPETIASADRVIELRDSGLRVLPKPNVSRIEYA